MASKSYLLCLVLILMSVFASARRPLVVESNTGFEPASVSLDGDGKIKNGESASQTDGSRSIIDEVPLPSPLSKGGNAPPPDGKQSINDEASVPLPSPMSLSKGRNAPPTDGSQSISDEASVPLPSPMGLGKDGSQIINGVAYVPFSAQMSLGRDGMIEIGGDEKQGGVAKGVYEKTEDRNRRLNTQPGSMAIGLIPFISGGDGSFHFSLGPINFGGNIGWGGFTPGYVYSQPQPYIVVSPYTSAYPMPSQYAPPMTGYSRGQPSQGYSGPYPPARGYAPGSPQLGGSAANQHN